MSNRELPRRGRRSGKGVKIRRYHTLQISSNMPTTIAIIATLMTTMRKSDRNYIQIWTQRTTRSMESDANPQNPWVEVRTGSF
jgi:hypothetical protein